MESAEGDPDKLASELEHETDRLEQHAKELGEDIDEVRQEWKHKRNDPNIPGAPPDEEPSEEQDARAEPEDQPG